MCRGVRRREALLVPPEAVLAALYESHPAFELDSQRRVRPSVPLDVETELPRSDRILVEALRASWTGVLERRVLRAACAARGLADGTFESGLSYSVVVDNPARDLWCLRGTRVSAVTVAALRYARDAQKQASS
jgi:hypothetical protein